MICRTCSLFKGGYSTSFSLESRCLRLIKSINWSREMNGFLLEPLEKRDTVTERIMGTGNRENVTLKKCQQRSQTFPQRCSVSRAADRGCRETSGRPPTWNRLALFPQPEWEQWGLCQKICRKRKREIKCILSLHPLVWCPIQPAGGTRSQQWTKTLTVQFAQSGPLFKKEMSCDSKLIFEKDCRGYECIRNLV